MKAGQGSIRLTWHPFLVSLCDSTTGRSGSPKNRSYTPTRSPHGKRRQHADEPAAAPLRQRLSPEPSRKSVTPPHLHAAAAPVIPRSTRTSTPAPTTTVVAPPRISADTPNKPRRRRRRAVDGILRRSTTGIPCITLTTVTFLIPPGDGQRIPPRSSSIFTRTDSKQRRSHGREATVTPACAVDTDTILALQRLALRSQAEQHGDGRRAGRVASSTVPRSVPSVSIAGSAADTHVHPVHSRVDHMCSTHSRKAGLVW